MSVRSPLVLVSVLLIAAIAGFFFLVVRGDGDSISEKQGRESAALPSQSTDLVEPEAGNRPEQLSMDSELETRSQGQGENAEAGPGREALTTGQVVLAGQVTFPVDMPADEQPLVVALRNKTGVRQLGGGSAFTAVWGSGDLAVGGEGEGSSDVLASAPVQADGSFLLELPAETIQAHLAISGRYLYSESTSFFEGSQAGISLRPRLGAWITGRVHAAQGATDLETEGLKVALFPDLSTGRFDPMAMQTGFVSSEAEASADGKFTFRGVPTAIDMALVARTEKHAMPLELGLSLTPGEHRVVQLTAQTGATLMGTVLDENGKAAPETDIDVILPGLMGQAVREVRSTESDDQGAFALEGLPSGELSLKLETEGYADQTIALEEPLSAGETRTGLELTLDRGASVAGRVLFSNGNPAPNCMVRISMDASAFQMGMGGMGNPTSGGSDTTDAEGKFRVSGLKGGPFLVRASLEVSEGELEGSWNVRKEKVKADSDELELRMQKTAEIRVRVTDIEGMPLEKFNLQATLEGTAGAFGIGAERANQVITDAENGTGSLRGLAPGDWTLDVRADGFADPEQLAFQIPRDDELLEVTLYPTATVMGRVVDSSGEAVPDASVTLSQDLAAIMSGGPQPPTTITDEEGNFILTGLNPGSMAVVAKAEGFAPSTPEAVELESGQILDEIELMLPVGGTILGLVLDDEGEGKSGMMISAQQPPNYGEQRIDRTDSDGRFVLEHLEAGRWQVTALQDMLSKAGTDEEVGDMAELLKDMQMDFVEVIDGEVVELVLGAQSAGSVNVSVRVQSNGEGVEQALVNFIAEDSEGAPAMLFRMTDAEGRAKLQVEHPGTFLVSVQQNMAMGRQSSVEFIEIIPEVEDYELVLDLPVGTISGRVYSPEGDPLSGCRVTVTVEDGMNFGTFMGGNYSEIVTDEDGDYRVDNLRAGTYSVAAGGPAMGGMFGGNAPGGRIVHGGVKVSEGQEVDGINFHLEQSGSISGLVHDQSNAPVPAAAIFVRDENGLLLERFSFMTSAENGRFHYPGVSPGTYFVSARVGDQVSHESAPIRVTGGKDVEVNLSLEAGTILLIRVIDKSGKDVQARVRAIDPNGHEVTGMLSMSDIMENFGAGFSSSIQRVGPLAAGRYSVEVTTEDGRTATKPVTLGGRDERKLTVRVR